MAHTCATRRCNNSIADSAVFCSDCTPRLNYAQRRKLASTTYNHNDGKTAAFLAVLADLGTPTSCYSGDTGSSYTSHDSGSSSYSSYDSGSSGGDSGGYSGGCD